MLMTFIRLQRRRDDFKRDWVLRNTEVKEVWGVGRRMTAHPRGDGHPHGHGPGERREVRLACLFGHLTIDSATLSSAHRVG
ncbi:hypothetical protein KSS90_17460 [Pseudomonas maumuensis]|uniref:Uncharacterized protein n=1 Tax=Pseudomonas maumuensis TaxID=2842354 RepID=A0ABX8NT60_9PSED|nr:hypothetical protein [Pseudomonas maumuensis]QXH59262.1 hypothetical protein KSS90_17460 [Pseudomonas maumuensis]